MEEQEEMGEDEAAELEKAATAGPVSHRDLMKPGFDDELSSTAGSATEFRSARTQRRKREREQLGTDAEIAAALSDMPKRRRVQTRREARASPSIRSSPSGESDEDEFVPDIDEHDIAAIGESGDDQEELDEDAEGDFPLDTPTQKKLVGPKRKDKKVVESAAEEEEDPAGVDDGNEQVYQSRVQSWVTRRREARRKARARHAKDPENGDNEELADPGEEVEEWFQPHPSRPDAMFEGGYNVPGDIYPSLFDYQKTGVQWLWELYSQSVGGIIGDEMGLGKTIQAISFLAGLHYSKKVTKPIIVVCPATVMKQWVNEFHRWWPPLRVSILHTSGSGMINIGRESRIEDDLEMEVYGKPKKSSKGQKAAEKIVDRVSRDGHILVTTYSGLQTYAELLIPMEW
ncbi:hypothetical protein LTS18_014751, partial [Coniosporium uncinatum]